MGFRGTKFEIFREHVSKKGWLLKTTSRQSSYGSLLAVYEWVEWPFVKFAYWHPFASSHRTFFLSHTVFRTEPQLHVTEHLEEAIFLWESTVANLLWNLIGSQGSSDLPISDHGHGNAHAHCVSVKRSTIRKWFEGKEKKIIIYTGLVSIHAVKNCDLGHENTVLGSWTWAAISKTF